MRDEFDCACFGARRRRKPRVITIIGRRWFNRGPGNTYHSAEIYLDGEPVEGIDFAYGYGEQYLYNALSKLISDGLVPPLDREYESPWQWSERTGIKIVYSVADVPRKKDL